MPARCRGVLFNPEGGHHGIVQVKRKVAQEAHMHVGIDGCITLC